MTTPDQNPGCLGFLLRLFSGGRAPEAPAFPYRVRDDFLSPAEMSFYRVLLAVLDERALVCPKVGLRDILFVTQPQENRAALNRIAQKHIDFLVCDPGTLRPRFAVELDDASHARADRQARDGFVEAAFQAARLPLLRVSVRAAYSVPDLAAQIAPLLAPDAPTPVAPGIAPTPVSDAAPLCPKCGVPLVLRVVAKGERQGQTFYGCPHYPRCRETASAPSRP